MLCLYLMVSNIWFHHMLSGWVPFSLLGWSASMCYAFSALCTINVGLSWQPTSPMREYSRPPSPTTSTWVCCFLSSSSVCYRSFTLLCRCHLRLTAGLLGNNKKNTKCIRYIFENWYKCELMFIVGRIRCLMWSWRQSIWTCLPSWGRYSAM